MRINIILSFLFLWLRIIFECLTSVYRVLNDKDGYLYDVETKSSEKEFDQLQPFSSYSFFIKRKGDASFTVSADARTAGLGNVDEVWNGLIN